MQQFTYHNVKSKNSKQQFKLLNIFLLLHTCVYFYLS